MTRRTPNPDFKVTAFLESNISKTVQRTKLLENTNRKSYMAGRFMSVSITLSDLERSNMRNQIFFFRRILVTLVRSAMSLYLHKCVARFVSDSWVSCLFLVLCGRRWQLIPCVVISFYKLLFKTYKLLLGNNQNNYKATFCKYTRLNSRLLLSDNHVRVNI